MYEFLEYCAEDVMTKEPITTRPDALLSEVEAIFDEHEFNGLPVLDPEGKLLGVVTKLDLLRAFRFNADQSMFPPYKDIMSKPVQSVMSMNTLSVTPRAPLPKVLEKLVSTGIKSLPVLDGDELVGIVSREDVLGALRQAAAGQRPRLLEEPK